jgi:hypothetical protein
MPAKKQQSTEDAEKPRGNKGRRKLRPKKIPFPLGSDLPLTDFEKEQPVSAHVAVQKFWKGTTWLNRRPLLHIIIKDAVTSDEIRDDLPTILQMQREMISSEGSDPNRLDIALFTKMMEWKRKGVSAGMQAKDRNYDLICAVLWGTDEHAHDPWRETGLAYFRGLLDVFAFDASHIDEDLEDATTRIQAGHAPWPLSTGPIQEAHVNYAFQAIERNEKAGNIVLAETAWGGLIDKLLIGAAARGYGARASEMLERDYPDDFNQYRQRLQERVDDVSWVLLGKTG